RRSGLLTAAVLASVLLAGAAAAPGPPVLSGPVPVPVAAPTAFRLTGSTLFVGAADQSIAAYPVPALLAAARPDPRPIWRVRLAGWSDTLRWVADAGVLLATIYPGSGGGSGPRPDRAPQVVALDGRTGRTLWTDGPATVLDAPPGGYGLLQVLRVGVPDQLRWTDLRSGRVAWSRALSLGTQADLADPAASDPAAPAPGAPDLARPGRVLLTEPSGSAVLLDEATGTAIAGGELGSLGGNPLLFSGPAGGPPDPFAGRLGLLILRGEVLVHHITGRASSPGVTGTLTAFELATLGRMWSVVGPFSGDPVGCAPLVCLSGINGTVAVDPGTGAVRWSAPQWRAGSELPDGRVLAASRSAPARTALLDPATGRVTTEFPGAWQALATGTSSRVLLVSEVDAHRSAVAVLDTGAPGPRVIDQLPDVEGRTCQAAGPALACEDGQLRVWWSTTAP
ncbi:MAG: PQQ-binding-like beta-propeller repeat protein, partial [Micromonosporaceae bacterium]|nr:PQQ-binding-like beta-propeller repeat protein [Micromonosporaceae bacterium]